MARPWTTLLLHAAFILLSGASEPRRCYWCGPLAEQVHRSRHSAPCGASDHVTVCEPGYNYCAVVATSPPRVESRYCVKMYQDECYPLFCNSTKTWKMTCPCRGDLCNGPNTEREVEAFAILPKLVAKTHNARIKKRTASASPHLIKQDSNNNKIIANADAEIHILSSVKMNNITNDNILIVIENDGNLYQKSGIMQSEQPTNQPVVVEHHNEENDQSTIANPDNIQTSSTVNNQLIEIVIHVSEPTEKSMKENEELCTDSPTTTTSNETNKNTESVKEEGEPILPLPTTVQSQSNAETSMKPAKNTNAAETETINTTETVQQPAMERKPTDKSHTESPANITVNMQNAQPRNPMEEMQNDATVISPTETIQFLKTTEVNKMYGPPTKETVKASDGMPTAEALQQNGSPSVAVAPVPVTEKSTEATTPATEATTVPTVLTTQKQIIKNATTPAPRRKNNAVQITFSYNSYALLFICGVYL